jgi:predicted RNA-binding protein with RPS1 domain
MEKVIEVGEGKRGKAELELKRVKEEKTKQLKVLEDMLQFERQNLATQEASFKQAKKLLVREVKVCRAQLVTMQAERDGMRGERDQLRDALQGGGRRSSLSPGGQ